MKLNFLLFLFLTAAFPGSKAFAHYPDYLENKCRKLFPRHEEMNQICVGFLLVLEGIPCTTGRPGPIAGACTAFTRALKDQCGPEPKYLDDQLCLGINSFLQKGHCQALPVQDPKNQRGWKSSRDFCEGLFLSRKNLPCPDNGSARKTQGFCVIFKTLVPLDLPLTRKDLGSRIASAKKEREDRINNYFLKLFVHNFDHVNKALKNWQSKPCLNYQTKEIEHDYLEDFFGTFSGEAYAYSTAVFIDPQDGKFYDINQKPVQGKGVFVMDQFGNFYFHPPDYEGTEGKFSKFFHTQFHSGRPVAAAGEITFDQGVLIQMENKSGHYKPGPEFFHQALDSLKKQKADLSRLKKP